MYVITYAAMSTQRTARPGSPPPAFATVGPRVKALREAEGLSLRDLAERSGVSAPMLSQVERGETSPTLQVAGRIASGLELSLSQLLRLDEGGSVSVVKAGAAPGGRAAPPTHEPGAREIVHVESGRLRLVIDGATHELAAGDTVTFDA